MNFTLLGSSGRRHTEHNLSQRAADAGGQDPVKNSRTRIRLLSFFHPGGSQNVARRASTFLFFFSFFSRRRSARVLRACDELCIRMHHVWYDALHVCRNWRGGKRLRLNLGLFPGLTKFVRARWILFFFLFVQVWHCTVYLYLCYINVKNGSVQMNLGSEDSGGINPVESSLPLEACAFTWNITCTYALMYLFITCHYYLCIHGQIFDKR